MKSSVGGGEIKTSLSEVLFEQKLEGGGKKVFSKRGNTMFSDSKKKKKKKVDSGLYVHKNLEMQAEAGF